MKIDALIENKVVDMMNIWDIKRVYLFVSLILILNYGRIIHLSLLICTL